MTKSLSPHRLGLAFGLSLGLLHAIWATVVAISPAMVEAFYKWILDLHFINLQLSINPFEFGKAVMLVCITTIFGYFGGFVFGYLHKLLEE